MPDDSRPWACAWAADGPWSGPFPTRDAATRHALDHPPLVCDHPRVFLARAVTPAASLFLGSVDALLPEAASAAVQMHGPAASEWLANVPEDQLDDLQVELDQVFDAWAARHGHQPAFFRVEDVTGHRLTEFLAEPA